MPSLSSHGLFYGSVLMCGEILYEIDRYMSLNFFHDKDQLLNYF